eukprot:jgi/Ulvmu1/5172/UM021_0189.1
MLHLHRTAAVAKLPCSPLKIGQRRSQSLLGVAAFPPDAPARQTVPIMSRIGQCAGAVALATMLAASAPDASEAAKSGGRTGGSNFSRSRTERAAPRAQAPAPQVNNYYASPSPFGFSPFGLSPFGFSPFGFGFGPTVVVGGGGGIGLFSIIFDIMLLGIVFTAISSVFSAFQNRGTDKKRDDDGW